MDADALRTVLQARGENVHSIDLWQARDQQAIYDCTTSRGFARLVTEPYDPRLTVGVKVSDTAGREWSIWPFPHDSRIPGMATVFLGHSAPFDEIRPVHLSRYFPDVPRCVILARDSAGIGYYVKCYGNEAAYEKAKAGHALWEERMEARGFTALDHSLTLMVKEIDGHVLDECLTAGHGTAEVRSELRAQMGALMADLSAVGLEYRDFHRHNVLVTHDNGEHRLHLIDLDSITESPRKD